MLSGMSSLAQMEDNLRTMGSFETLTDEQAAVIDRARTALTSVDSIGCTGCRYCVDGCPMSIQIPGVFAAMNHWLIYEDGPSSMKRYLGATKDHGKAGDCIGCGQCENACPQHLPVIELLKKCAGKFDQA